MGLELNPSYLELDFTTSKTKFRTLLEHSDIFKDYNFEGSNISMLIELLSYVSDQNSYYTNLLAKNGFEDTTDIYEVLHRIVKNKGYQPKGSVSGQTTLNLSLSGLSPGEQVLIEPWQSIDTGLVTPDGTSILYSYVPNSSGDAITYVTSGGLADISLIMREGEVVSLNYMGEDLVNNQIILPLYKFDYGAYPYSVESVQIFINDPLVAGGEVGWTRVNDFYENLSGTTSELDNNVYQLNYDKYQRYVIEFSSARNIPSLGSVITMKLLKSNGTNGIVDKNAISKVDGLIITGSVSNTISTDLVYSVYNSDVSQGASDPESLEDLRNNSKATVRSQLRNITKEDYKNNLESRTDVVVGHAWGEQDVNPGAPIMFNKVYISVIPPLSGSGPDFQSGTLETSSYDWELQGVTSPLLIPVDYDSGYKTDLISFIESRKGISVYEEMAIPKFVYFTFEIGVRIKRNYVFAKVSTDLKNKLKYYFDFNFRKFGETIDFMDITEFLTDPSNTSSTDDFTNTRGIRNIVFRDLNVYSTESLSATDIFTYSNAEKNFPQFSSDRDVTNYDNTIRGLILNYDQFPMLSIDHCIVVNEG